MKNFLLNALAALLAVLAPIKPLLLVTGALIFADFITGLLAAKHRKQKITSAAMRRTIAKLFVYHLVLIMGFLVETYLLNNAIPIAKLTAAIIGLVEMKSLLENCNDILGKDIFREIIKKLGSEKDNPNN